jgi:hypothetical protein
MSKNKRRMWSARAGQQILYPFTRFGFGERFFSFRAGLFTLILLHFVAWGITKAVFFPQEKILSALESDTEESKNEVREKSSLDKLVDSMRADSIRRAQEEMPNPIAMPQEEIGKREEAEEELTPSEKLDKEKSEFRRRFLTLYIFTGFYFAFILWHRQKYKARLASDSYDYSRESYFDGYSWPLMWWLAKYTRRYLLYAKYVLKQVLIYAVTLVEYLSYRLSQKMQGRQGQEQSRAIVLSDKKNVERFAPTNEEKSESDTENHTTNRNAPLPPKLNLALIEMHTYAEHSHLTEYKVLECIVEPLILIIIGWVQIQFDQWLGYYFVFAGMFLALFTYLIYVGARNGTLDKIDALFELFREKSDMRYRKEALAQYGYRSRAPMPGDAEILENLAPHVGKKKDRFIVT